jgi:LAO/AO transport system kinase
MVDFFLLVVLSGAGDELQGMKRGVMELADLVMINKADGDNLRAAELARSQAQNALHYFPAPPSGWTPQALCCSAQTGKGIDNLWSAVLDYVTLTKSNGWFSSSRHNQARKWMEDMIEQALIQSFESNSSVRAHLAQLNEEVMQGRTTPFRAARILLETYAQGKQSS